MGAPPVDWEQPPTAGAGYRPPSYSEHRERAQAGYPQQPAPGYAQPADRYPPIQYAQQPQPYQAPPGPAGYPGQYQQQQYPPQPGQYPAQPPQYQAQPPQYPAQQYPGQPGYPPQYQYGPPQQGYQQQPPYGPPQQGYPGQQPYPYYGAPPARPGSPMKQPGGGLAAVGMLFAIGSMVSVMLANLTGSGGPPPECLAAGLLFGIIGCAFGAAAWAKGNKAGKGAVAMSVAFMVASIVIALMWAAAFG